jgi:hypothetical protein
MWPPKPFTRFIVRTEIRELAERSGTFVSWAEADYVWVYPGQGTSCGGTIGPKHDWTEEASPGQEIAIRCLEER